MLVTDSPQAPAEPSSAATESPPPWQRPTYPVDLHPSGTRIGVEKISYTHDGMIDHILANPGISQGELGYIYGYSAGWISQIMASDAFQARMHERREAIIDPAIRLSMKERFEDRKSVV